MRPCAPCCITDHFSFGLGLCGVGGNLQKQEGPFWYLTVNHVNPEVGGEAAKLHAGDEVVWYLAASYPYPEELALSAPATARVGRPFAVRVFSYNEKGRRSPAAGVRVTGASGTTDAGGRASVKLSKPALLVARGLGDIPSNRVAVCVGGRCPERQGR